VTTAQLAVVALAVLWASLVQVVSGFGFGLLSVPIMALAIHPRQAVVVSTLLGILMSGWQAWHLRHHADRLLVRRLTASAFVGMPIGLWVYGAVTEHVLQVALGIMVLVAVGLLATRASVDRGGTALELAAGFVSGVLNTSLSTNGPPLAFVLQARGLTATAFRATIARVFSYSAVFALTLFISRGRVNHDGLVAAAIAVPAMVAGQLLGFPLRRHVEGERFRRLVLTLMVLAAVTAIAGAFRSS
jgi:uncharacterized protein